MSNLEKDSVQDGVSHPRNAACKTMHPKKTVCRHTRPVQVMARLAIGLGTVRHALLLA